MGQPVAHDEWNRLAGADIELADGLQILAAERRRRAQNYSFRSADRGYPAFRQPLYPGYDGAVVETQDELGAHRDAPAEPPDQPHKVGKAMMPGDKIDEFDRTRGCLEQGYQYQRTIHITALDPCIRLSRRDQPAAVFRLAEKRREAGCRIKTRQAEPVDGAIAPDQRGCRAIADQGIVFDPLVRWHRHVTCCSAQSISHGSGKLEPMGSLT